MAADCGGREMHLVLTPGKRLGFHKSSNGTQLELLVRFGDRVDSVVGSTVKINSCRTCGAVPATLARTSVRIYNILTVLSGISRALPSDVT